MAEALVRGAQRVACANRSLSSAASTGVAVAGRVARAGVGR